MCKCIYAAHCKDIYAHFLVVPLGCNHYYRAFVRYEIDMRGQHDGLKCLDVTIICGIVIFTPWEAIWQIKGADRKQLSQGMSSRQHGSLNPRPGGVGNDLFLTHHFLMHPKDLVQVKYEMLRQVSVERGSVTEAAAQFGLSRPSFYEAQTAFQQDGSCRVAAGEAWSTAGTQAE